jgi:hypothetical protein
MKVADILRTLANNLDHAQGGTPDPRIQNPAELIDVVVASGPADAEGNPGGTTPAGNDKEPENLFLPPLQQKQELLKKAVGVENVYDDGTPAEQHEQACAEEDDMTQERGDIVDRIKRLSGIPTAAVQELSNDEVFDD